MSCDLGELRRAKTIQWGEDESLSQGVWGQLEITCKRRKLDPSLTPYAKVKSQEVGVLNIRAKMIKLLEKGATARHCLYLAMDSR